MRDIVDQCSRKIYEGTKVPVEDIRDILAVIEEFVGHCHHGKEECVYFPSTYNADQTNKKETDALEIEHELGRRIGKFIEKSISGYLSENKTEPMARFLKAYRAFLDSHLSREETFFGHIDNSLGSEQLEDNEVLKRLDNIAKTKLSHERHRELQDMVASLESREWMKK